MNSEMDLASQYDAINAVEILKNNEILCTDGDAEDADSHHTEDNVSSAEEDDDIDDDSRMFDVCKLCMDNIAKLTPKAIVDELDKYVIGQNNAKRAIAISIRNRWRNQHVDGDIKHEITPKNILMQGPTGVGKTELARRISKILHIPFIKVEATKFTEVGYVGRDVDSIIRDLVNEAYDKILRLRKDLVRDDAIQEAESIILKKLIGESASEETTKIFLEKLRSGDLDHKIIEIEVESKSSASMPHIDIPGGGGMMGMINLKDIIDGMKGSPTKSVKMPISRARETLIEQEIDKLINAEEVSNDAVFMTENASIVFIDEIDKVVVKHDSNRGHDVSRSGVQRDLLPLIEGTIINTKYGSIKTDKILFICSGAFHQASPSDLIAELQGRLPIRVKLSSLTKDDFKKILLDTHNSIIKQYIALLVPDNIRLDFSDGAIDMICEMAANENETIEDIGARRLHAIIESLLEDVSFNVHEKETAHSIDVRFIKKKMQGRIKKNNSRSFI